MKNLGLVLILFIVTALTSGCAKKGGREAELQFHLGASFDSQGGAMLWGHNKQTGEKFADRIDVNSNHSRFLPFGPYMFWVIAWAGDSATGQKLVGLTKCDFKAINIQNDGSTQPILFNLNNAKCAQTAFTPHSNSFQDTNSVNYNMFPAVRVKSCRDLDFTTGFNDRCSSLNITAGNSEGESGFVSSFRLAMIPHHNFNPNGPPLTSSCVEVDNVHGDQAIDMLKANIPVGAPDAPFMTVIKAYYGSTDCDETADTDIITGTGAVLGSKDFIFPMGLQNPSPTGPTKHFFDNSGNYCTAGMSIYDTCEGATLDVCQGTGVDGQIQNNGGCVGLSPDSTGTNLNMPTVYTTPQAFQLVLETTTQDVCQGARLNEPLVAAGRGDGRPFVICHENQYNSIGGMSATVPTLMGHNYVLGRDLDMNTANASVTNYYCGQYPQSNTIPWGGTHDNPGTCTNPYAGTAFSGIFDGNHYTIRNARFGDDDLVDLGLIRNINAGEVANLNIADAEIRGKFKVGILAGFVQGQADIYNIHISHSDVEARDDDASLTNVGGLVGEARTAAGTQTYFDIDLEHVSVFGWRDNVGGIFGELISDSASIDVEEATFSGQVEAEYEAPGIFPNRTGGIVGNVNWLSGAMPVKLTKVASKGTIRSNGRFVGGIIGNSTSASLNLRNVYSTAVVQSSNQGTPSVRLGGLVGNNPSGEITHAIFTGVIIHKCQAANATCEVGEISGNNIAYGTTVVSEGVAAIAPLGGGVGSTYPYGDLSDKTSTFNTTTLTSWTDPDCGGSVCFIHLYNDIPRLATENLDCVGTYLDDVPTQRVSGAGTSATNPIYICTRNQMKQINDDPANNYDKFYQLKQDVYLGVWDSDRIGSASNKFNGSFNGDLYTLYGAQLSTAAGDAGIFGYIGTNGDVYALKLSANHITNSNVNNLGILAGRNEGAISNIFLMGGKVHGNSTVGGLVGINDGLIENVWGGAEVFANSNLIGGIVGRNNGTVTNVHSYSSPLFNNPNLVTLGGIVGNNSGGTISRSEFKGQLGFFGSNFSDGGIGAIAGYSSGTIEDVLVSPEAKINLGLTNVYSQGVGCIVGEMGVGGTLDRSLCLAPIQTDIENTQGSPCAGGSAIGTETSQTQCHGMGGTWTPPVGFNIAAVANVGGLVGVDGSAGGIDANNNFFAFYPRDLIYSPQGLPTCSPSGGNVRLSFSSMNAVTINTGDVVEFRSDVGFRSLSVVAGPFGTGITHFDVDGAGEDCNDWNETSISNEIRVYRPQIASTNTASNGFHQNIIDLADFDTYCPSAAGSSNQPNFSCNLVAGEFDLVTDPGHPRNLGYQRLIDAYFNFDFFNPPTNPVWTMETGSTPKLFDPIDDGGGSLQAPPQP